MHIACRALKDITPSSQRSSLVYARALPDMLRPLLDDQLERIREDISAIFALRKEEGAEDEVAANTNSNSNRNHNSSQGQRQKRCSQHYHYLIHGSDSGRGQGHLGTAVLHLMEEYPLYSLDLASLYGDSSTKCADEAILRIFKEAQRNTPSVIYWPHLDRWWAAAHSILKTSLALLIGDIAHDCPVLLVATTNVSMHQLDDDVQALFAKFAFHDCDRELTTPQRRRFWT